MPHPISTHPMNEPGAILAELNALRLLYREAVARLKRARKHTRNAEEMAPREAAEQLGSLARLFEAAYEKHLTIRPPGSPINPATCRDVARGAWVAVG